VEFFITLGVVAYLSFGAGVTLKLMELEPPTFGPIGNTIAFIAVLLLWVPVLLCIMGRSMVTRSLKLR
jgi:hypothetical protein